MITGRGVAGVAQVIKEMYFDYMPYLRLKFCNANLFYLCVLIAPARGGSGKRRRRLERGAGAPINLLHKTFNSDIFFDTYLDFRLTDV